MKTSSASGPRLQCPALFSERLDRLARAVWPYLLLLGTLWVVRYWHSAEFGLYEDDLTHLPRAATMSWEQVIRFALDPERIIRLHGQGHPLHYTFIYTLTKLGWYLGDLRGLYLVGYSVEAINVCLFYSLLRRLHSRALGLLGGLAYVLYAADTTQAFLTYSLGLQPSLTCLLLAAHAYLSGRLWLTYPLASLTLLTYETVFPVALAFPLLVELPRRKWVRASLRHAALCVLILLAVVGWRLAVGENRVGELTVFQAVATPVLHMIQGPVVSLGTYLYRPIQALQAMNLEIAIVSSLYLALFVVLAAWLRRAGPMWDVGALRQAWAGTGGRQPLVKRMQRVWQTLPKGAQVLLRLAAAGLVMLVLAYPLTFTVRAYAISGRESRVHAAGIVGAAVVIGSLMLASLTIPRRGPVLAAAMAIWVGLLAGFGFVVQRDYVLGWQYQRQFWAELLPLIADAENGTAVLVDPSGLPDTVHIGANTWNLPRVLEQLYEFPQSWSTPPRVFRLVPGWEHRLVSETGLFQLNGATVTAPVSVLDRYPSRNVILIRTDGGLLARQTTPLRIPGGEFSLKPRGQPVLATLPRGPLYSLLLSEISAAPEGMMP